MRVLVTGSSGQIGTALALQLQARGDQVEGIDARPNSWTDRIPGSVVDLVDLARREVPLARSARPDVVVHLAAHAKVFELVQAPMKSLENVLMLFPALEYARRERVPFILASSREVYGEIHHPITAEPDADFVVAHSPYSASKLSAEAFLYSYHKCYQLPYVVFRFSNVYGRYDCDLARMERVIPLFIKMVAEDKPITVFGREKILDFTFIDDCVNGVVRGIDALASGRLVTATINLAYGQGYSLEDAAVVIGLALGKSPNVTYLPSRTGEVTRYVADISAAAELLGYKPETRLPVGIEKAIAWQRETGRLVVK